MANVVVSGLATWNGKALKKAKQDVAVFDKQVKKLGRTFGLTFSAAALVAFSKKAIKAFTDDEAAAKRLQLQLENTGNAFRVSEVEAYIKSLEKTLGILDDLRGPFQTFLNATGSVELAQRSLEAALNISAGTGESLGTVVNAISAGIRGQTKAIKGLNTGIDENIIATGDMNKIMAALEKRFSGQSLARLDTYAGKMDVLKKGVDEATKAIGTGLVDALVILSKDKSVESLADNFENLGDNIAYAIVEMAKLIKKFDDLVSNPSFKAGLLALAIYSKRPQAVVGAMGIIGLDAVGGALTQPRAKTQPNMGGYSGIPDIKVAKELLKARKKEYDIINKKNAIENKNVEELKKKFDLERIGITQALNVATDDETKLRLRAQLAILDNNDAMAKKLLAELEAYEALKKLADAANKAADALDRNMNKYDALIAGLIKQFEALGLTLQESMALASMSARYQAQADAIAAGKGPITGGTTLTPRLPALPASYFQDLATQLVGTANYAGMNVSQIAEERARESGNRSVDVNLRIDSPSGDRFAQLMAESIQVANRSGYSTTPNGGLQ
jgi:ribosomal protein L7Ae-like RNA K-turn-binding protein